MKLSIGKAWDESRAILARDGALIMIVAAALVLLPEALSNLISPPVQASASGDAVAADPFGGLMGFIATLASLLGGLAITAIALRPGHTVKDAIGNASKAFLPVLGVALIVFLPLILVAVAILAAGVGGDTPEQMLANLKSMSPGVAFALLAWMLVVLYVGLRMMLTSPIALSESHKPFEIIKRSWALTAGHLLRLLGYVLVVGIVALCLAGAAGIMSGILAKLVFGDPEPLSVSALVIGLFSGLASAFVVTVSALMSARIYAQLTTTLSVPKVEH